MTNAVVLVAIGIWIVLQTTKGPLAKVLGFE